MRIAVFTDSFLPQVNGVSIGTMNLVEQLPRHEFLIVCPAAREPMNWKAKNCKILQVSPSISLPTYKDYKVCFFLSHKLREQILSFKPDVILSHTPFFIGKKGLEFSKKLKVPIIGVYNTLLPDFLMYLPLPIIRNTGFAKRKAWEVGNSYYEQCDVVVSPSNAMLSELRAHGLKHKRMLKITFGVNEDFYNAAKKARKDSKLFKIVYMGRLSFEKNVDVLVKAFAIIAKKHSQARLVLIGSGPASDSLKALASELGVSEKVEFTGVLRGKTLAEKMASCNLYASASTIETQGIVHFEAMASGLPAVVANKMANPEAVRDNYNGFLFKPFDEKDCASKIEKVLKSPALQSKLSKNARKFAEGFRWRKIAGEFELEFKQQLK